MAPVLLTSCVSNPSFFLDQRVEIVEPAGLEETSIPFRVSWTSEIPERQRYALFVGVPPIGVGQHLDMVPRRGGDAACLVNPECPDVAYLERNNVYLTTDTEVEVSSIPPLGRGVTVVEARLVLIDEDGRRQSEAVWTVRIKPKAGT